MISSASSQGHERSTVGKIISQTSKALDSVAFAHAIPQVLQVTSSLIVNIISGSDSTDSQDLTLSLVKQVGDLRTHKAFEYKENADETLSTAMRVLGPQRLLEILPLNLEPGDR
jgi:ribosomal RNA-processing protein 12